MRPLLLLMFILAFAFVCYLCAESNPTPRGAFSDEEVTKAAMCLNIPFKDFTINDLRIGMNQELEHGYCDPATNVTNDDLMMTAKIAWAHLKANPGSYTLYGH